jgi:predicted transcriptional regulator
MRTKTLAAVLERVEAWPAAAQDELAEIAREMDAVVSGEDYDPTPEEVAGIERGLRAAEAGRFATNEEVEAVLAKLRSR